MNLRIPKKDAEHLGHCRTAGVVAQKSLDCYRCAQVSRDKVAVYIVLVHVRKADIVILFVSDFVEIGRLVEIVPTEVVLIVSEQCLQRKHETIRLNKK